MTINGTAGNDTLVGTGAADQFVLTQGGNDSASGGAGKDLFKFGATFAAGDSVNGGIGDDTISLNGDYSFGLTITGAMMTGVETITLAAGHDYALTLDNSAVTIGQSLTVDGSALGVGDALLFDGTSETTSAYNIRGGMAGDLLYGGAAGDVFDLSLGGADEAHGGAGNDVFIMGAAFANGDTLDGGAGRDIVVLSGNYAATALDGVSEVERIVVLDGFDYVLAVGGDSIPSTGSLIVDGTRLTTGNSLILDLSAADDEAVAGARITATGGDGDDVVTLGSGFTASYRIDGGGGSNTLIFAGDVDVVLKSTTLQNFATMQFDTGNDYAIVAGHALVANAQVLTVDASNLGTGDNLTFDGSRERVGGAFAFTAGAGDDTLSGGRGNDAFDLTLGGDDTVNGGRGNNTFSLGGNFTADDRIDGGSVAGLNTLVLNGNYSSETFLTPDTLVNIDEIDLLGPNNYIFTFAANNLPAGQNLLVDATGAGEVALDMGHAAGNLTLHGSEGADEIFAGTGNRTLLGNGGNDVFAIASIEGTNFSYIVSGGADNDHFEFSGGGAVKTTDKIDGGTGNDTLLLQGDYFLIMNATTVVNVETMHLAFGFIQVATHEATVAAGQTMTVDASSATRVTFDGSAETNGHFIITGGHTTGIAGDDLTGGSLSDTFVYTSAADLAVLSFDRIHGLNYSLDKIDLTAAITVIDAALTNVTFNLVNSFEQNITAALNTHLGAAGHAITIGIANGQFAGHTFLVIDQNGTANYQSGGDLIIDVTGASGTLATTTFI